MLIGGVLGFAQGFLVGWSIFRFSDRHPVAEFQRADYQVALFHVFGHIVYGVILGFGFGLLAALGFDVSPAF